MLSAQWERQARATPVTDDCQYRWPQADCHVRGGARLMSDCCPVCSVVSTTVYRGQRQTEINQGEKVGCWAGRFMGNEDL